MEKAIIEMAKEKLDDSLGTQKYCTSHVAFCVPVHKNWYFKSFGTTTKNQWHVEFGLAPIENMGEGLIILNLVNGPATSMDAVDGQIKVQGTDVVGFKDWKDNAHFELIADARLKAAVSYLLTHFTDYTLAQ